MACPSSSASPPPAARPAWTLTTVGAACARDTFSADWVVQTASARVTEQITWRTVAFVLENAVFLVIGLQLTHSGRYSKPNDHHRPEPRIAFRHPILSRACRVHRGCRLLPRLRFCRGLPFRALGVHRD